MDLFQTYRLRQSIINSNFNVLHSVVSVTQINLPLYYVMSWGENKVYVYNEYWEFQRILSPSSLEYPFYGPTYSININGMIYVTANSVINKYDKYLTLTKQVQYYNFDSYAVCRGIYYNPVNQLIYVASHLSQKIHIFDTNLNLINSSSTANSPWFITAYNGQIVAGDNDNGKVYFYQNFLITKTISTQCNRRVSSILFDTNNNMLVLCESNNYLYIYDLNGSFTRKSILTCNKPASMNFDSKDRLVITCMNQIDIFY
jgi:DNA-binding beta-propeller fold protein YncE